MYILIVHNFKNEILREKVELLGILLTIIFISYKQSVLNEIISSNIS